MSSFSGEFLKRSVVDINGDLFGHLVDIVIEPRSGEIAEILVEVTSEIDLSKLPGRAKVAFAMSQPRKYPKSGHVSC